MTKRQWVDEMAVDSLEDFIVADGFDDAIVGVAWSHEGPRVIYDIGACVRILMTRDGMTAEDAEEYFNFSVISAHVGPQTPLFMECAPATPVALA